MAAHTYWRIYITANQSSSYTKISEIAFYDAAGSMVTAGGTAAASSEWSSTYASGKCFDNDFTSFWHTAAATVPQWISYQFATPVDVVTVRVSTPPHPDWLYGPSAFTVEYSDDGTSWTTAAGPFTPTWANTEAPSLSFRVGTGSGYVNVRFLVNATQNGGIPFASELEIHETIGGADVTAAVSKYCLDDPGNISFPALSAFDNNFTTDWGGGAAPPGRVIGQAFARPIAPVEIVWRSRSVGSGADSASSITMQGSNDGSTWSTIGTVTPAAWTSSNQAQTLSISGTAPTGALLLHPGMEGMRPVMYGGIHG